MLHWSYSSFLNKIYTGKVDLTIYAIFISILLPFVFTPTKNLLGIWYLVIRWSMIDRHYGKGRICFLRVEHKMLKIVTHILAAKMYNGILRVHNSIRLQSTKFFSMVSVSWHLFVCFLWNSSSKKCQSTWISSLPIKCRISETLYCACLCYIMLIPKHYKRRRNTLCQKILHAKHVKRQEI